MFNLVVTNVPGPQFPLYAAGARMQAAYPVVPLAKGQAVSIGLTSYDGGVFFGLNADRDAMSDVDVLAQCLVDALAGFGRPCGDRGGRHAAGWCSGPRSARGHLDPRCLAGARHGGRL